MKIDYSKLLGGTALILAAIWGGCWCGHSYCVNETDWKVVPLFITTLAIVAAGGWVAIASINKE